MRNVSLFVVALLSGVNSFAQFTSPGKVKVNPFISSKLRAQYAHTSPQAAKTTALKQRLIAQSEYGETGAIMDSFSVKYSGGRGSTFNAEFMNFGQWMGPEFPGFNDMITGFYTDGRHYNKNMGPDILGDTIRLYSMLPTPPYAFGHYGDQYDSYDGNNNLLDEYWLGAPTVGGTREYVLRYDSLNNIRRMSYIDWVGTMDTAVTAFLIYNSAGQVVVDSYCIVNGLTSLYQPASKFTYQYDTAGNMILGKSWEWDGAFWHHERDYVMSYYPGSNQLKNCSIFHGVIPETYDSFGYTPGITYTTYSKHVECGISWPSQVYEQIRHVGPSGLPDTIRSCDYTLERVYRYVYTYNSYNNPVVMKEYDSSASAYMNALTINYYYELYDATRIDNTTALKASTSVYPNPVSGTLYLSRKDFVTNKPESIRIFNQWGAVVKRETLYRTRETEELSLAELVPGMYTIYIECGGTAETRQIIKL